MNLFRLSLINHIIFPLIRMYVYMSTWNPADGEIYRRNRKYTRETENAHDNYAVSIMFNSYAVGHVPMGLNKPFSNPFSLPGSTKLCIITGKK